MHELYPSPEKYNYTDIEILLTHDDREQIRAHGQEMLDAYTSLAAFEEAAAAVNNGAFLTARQGRAVNIFKGFRDYGDRLMVRGPLVAYKSGLGKSVPVDHVRFPGIDDTPDSPDLGLGPVNRETGKMIILLHAMHFYNPLELGQPSTKAITHDAFWRIYGFIYDPSRYDEYFRGITAIVGEPENTTEAEESILNDLCNVLEHDLRLEP